MDTAVVQLYEPESDKLDHLRRRLLRAWSAVKRLIRQRIHPRGHFSLMKDVPERHSILPERLPPELLDYIIDFLHDDKDTLLQLSLVCHALVASARYHLFDRLTISDSNIRELSGILTETAPGVALCVRELRLVAGDGWSVFRELRGILAGKGMRTLLRMFLSVIAPRTPNVVRLVLKAVPLEGHFVEMLAACFPKLNALSLLYCACRSTGDLDKLVRDHPAIHTLRADRVCSVGGLTSPRPRAAVEERLVLRQPSPRPRAAVEERLVLRQLKVTEAPSPCPHTIIPWLSANCDPIHFIYTLYCLDGFHAVNGAIWNMCSLRHLHLIVYRWGRQELNDIKASPSKVQLRSPCESLAITTMTLDGMLHMLSLVVTILAQLDPSSFVFLREINILLHLEQTDVNKVEDISWRGMDETLSVLRSLRAVNFYHNPCYATGHVHVGLGVIEARLPTLCQLQKLRLQ